MDARDDPARKPGEQRRHRVDEHRRAPRKRRLQRRRAARHRRTRRPPQQGPRAPPLNRNPHARIGHGRCGEDAADLLLGLPVRRRNHDLQPLSRQQPQRPHEARQVPPDLPHAASRQEGQLLLILLDAPRRLPREHIHERMPDEARIEARPREERGFEREEAEELRERGRHLRDAVAVPGPDLRAHDVDGGDAARLRVRRELEVEARIVDRDDDVGTPVADDALQRPRDAEEVEEPADDGPEAHHREVARPEPLGVVAAEGDAAPGPRKRPGERVAQPFRVQHARLLAREQEDPQRRGVHRPSPRSRARSHPSSRRRIAA